MINDTLKKAQEAVKSLSEQDLFLVEEEVFPTAKLFRTCQNFEMLDFILFAQNMRKLALDKAKEEAKKAKEKAKKAKEKAKKAKEETEKAKEDANKAEEDTSDDPTKWLCALKDNAELFLQKHVVPYEEAKTHLKRNDEENADDLIFMFWRIPKLLPYAPTMTMLALIQGIPYEIFRDTELGYIELKNNRKFKVNANWLCEGLEKLINAWGNRTNYRSKRYRNKKPFCDEKTLKQDFWQMVLFIKMQQELVNLIKNYSVKENLIDLNAFFQDFCELWPYSPQLFLPIGEKQSRGIDEWKSMADYFFSNADQFQRSRMVDAIKKAKQFASIEEMLPVYSETFLIDDANWALLVQPDAKRWLVPATPYFAAYYFIDDFKIYGMLHYKDIGDIYKEKILNIMRYDRKKRDWVDDFLSQCEEIKKPTMQKSINSDSAGMKAWSENIIIREICSKYWQILENDYLFFLTSEEPIPFEIKAPDGKNPCIGGLYPTPIRGVVTIPVLRMTQYLKLKEARQDAKTQDSPSN